MSRYVLQDANGLTDGSNVPLTSYFSDVGDSSVFWSALRTLLSSRPVVRDSGRWLFDTAGTALELTRADSGWQISIFELPGGHIDGETGGSYEWTDRLTAIRRERAARSRSPLEVTIRSARGYDGTLATPLLRQIADRITGCIAPGTQVAGTVFVDASGNVSVSPEPTTTDDVMECVRTQASRMKAPRPSGGSAMIEFVAR